MNLSSCKTDPARTRLLNIALVTLMSLGLWTEVQGAEASQKTSPAQSTSQAQVARTIVFIGDSLTQGYGVQLPQAFPALVVQALNQRGKLGTWSVINAGVSGALSSEGPARVRWQLKARPDAVVLALGANDGLQGLSAEKLKANLDSALKLLLENQVPTFFIGMKMVRNLGDQYVREFEAVYSDLNLKYKSQFQKQNLPYQYDAFLLEGVALNSALNITDGRHPNVKGHKAIADRLLPLFEKFVSAIKPKSSTGKE